jgi:hypothetical protein
MGKLRTSILAAAVTAMIGVGCSVPQARYKMMGDGTVIDLQINKPVMKRLPNGEYVHYDTGEPVRLGDSVGTSKTEQADNLSQEDKIIEAVQEKSDYFFNLKYNMGNLNGTGEITVTRSHIKFMEEWVAETFPGYGAVINGRASGTPLEGYKFYLQSVTPFEKNSEMTK